MGRLRVAERIFRAARTQMRRDIGDRLRSGTPRDRTPDRNVIPGAGTGGQPACADRKRRSRRLLETTKTLESAIAAPASIGLSIPNAASGIAAAL